MKEGEGEGASMAPEAAREGRLGAKSGAGGIAIRSCKSYAEFGSRPPRREGGKASTAPVRGSASNGRAETTF